MIKEDRAGLAGAQQPAFRVFEEVRMIAGERDAAQFATFPGCLFSGEAAEGGECVSRLEGGSYHGLGSEQLFERHEIGCLDLSAFQRYSGGIRRRISQDLFDGGPQARPA